MNWNIKIFTNSVLVVIAALLLAACASQSQGVSWVGDRKLSLER